MKLYLLSWLVLPAVVLFVTINYVIGTINKPEWDNAVSMQNSAQVLGSNDALIIAPPAIEPIEINRGAITLWFDDGWLSQYSEGYKITTEYKMPAALAVPSYLIGYPAYMNWTQVKALQHNGWEITAHSRNHICDIDKLTTKFVQDEMLGSKQDLLALGLRADHYVTPCGIQTDDVIKTAKQYFFSLRTSEPGVNFLPIKDPYQLKSYVINNTHTIEDVQNWISEARRNRSWLIITLHQIDEESRDEYAITPALFEDLIDEVDKSNLPVVLPSQIMTKQ